MNAPPFASRVAYSADPFNRVRAEHDRGPVVFLSPLNGSLRGMTGDPIASAVRLLRAGEVVAVNGPSGCQLACDATNAASVTRLRAKLRRHGKPFVLMARDTGVVARYCLVTRDEYRELTSARAPIVLLPIREPRVLPDETAPGLTSIAFMLPAAPLHVLLLRDIDFPLVWTSGERWIVDDDDAGALRSDIASHLLRHDRAAANDQYVPMDHSVVRFMDGERRVLRRARGDALTPLHLPAGFETVPEILALGGERNATFCLIRNGQAIISHHLGDLERRPRFDDYRKQVALYRDRFGHTPEVIAADPHPLYRSSNLAGTMRGTQVRVQHQHAHVASCLCENGYPLAAPRVLGIVLDGAEWGTDGNLWGGEFLLADYRGFRRLAALRPVAMPGAAQATREPWRNLYAHIAASVGWDAFSAECAGLDVYDMLAAMPCRTLDAMIVKNINAPLASSCGRLFDAVAAALGFSTNRQAYPGDAAALLEAIADPAVREDAPYNFSLAPPDGGQTRFLDPAPMWRVLFADLAAGIPAPVIAAWFHNSVARALADTAVELARSHDFHVVALSGGCFRNRLLFEQTTRRFTSAGFIVLTHSLVPPNDGGLSLGQAAVAAAGIVSGAN